MSIKTIYKIKSDAINFFPSFYSDLIKEKDFWEQHHVPMEALEKVEAPFITYGAYIGSPDLSSRIINYSFHRNYESKFYFTVHLPKISFKKTNDINQNIKSIIDKFQSIINEEFYK